MWPCALVLEMLSCQIDDLIELEMTWCFVECLAGFGSEKLAMPFETYADSFFKHVSIHGDVTLVAKTEQS